MNLGGSFIAVSSDGFPILESDLEHTLSRDRSASDAKGRAHKGGGREGPPPKKSKTKSRKRSSKTGSASGSGSSPKEEKPQLMASSSRRTVDSCDSFAMLQSKGESINTTATHKTDQTQRVSNLRRKPIDNSDALMELPDEDLMDIDRSARTKSTRSSAQSGTPCEAVLTASERQLLEDTRFVRRPTIHPLLDSTERPDSMFSFGSEDHRLPLRPPPMATERPTMIRTGRSKSRSRKITKQKSAASRRRRGARASGGNTSRDIGSAFPAAEVFAKGEPEQGLPSRTKKPVMYGGMPRPQANDETAGTGVSGESAGSSKSTKLLRRMLNAQKGTGVARPESKLNPFPQEDVVHKRNSIPQMSSIGRLSSRRSSLVTTRSKQGVREDLEAFGSLSKSNMLSGGWSPGGLNHGPVSSMSTDQQEKPTYISRFSPETPSRLMPASLALSGGSKQALKSNSKRSHGGESFQTSFQTTATSITSMETDIPSGEEASSKASSKSSRRMLDEGKPAEGVSAFQTPPETSALRPPETPQGAYGSDRSLADSIDTEDMKDNIKVPGLLEVSGRSKKALGDRRRTTELDITRERSNRSNRSAVGEQKPSSSDETLEQSNQARNRVNFQGETDVGPFGEVAGERERDPKLSMRGISIDSSQRSRNQQSLKDLEFTSAALPAEEESEVSPTRIRSPRAKKRSPRRQRQHSSSGSEDTPGLPSLFTREGDSTFGDSPQTPRSSDSMPQHETPETAPLSATPQSTYPSDWDRPGSTLGHSGRKLASSGLSRKRPPAYTAGAFAVASEDFSRYSKGAAPSLDSSVVVGALSVPTPASDLKKHRNSLSSHGIQAAEPVVANAAYRVRHTKLQEEEVEYPKTHSKDHSTNSGEIEFQHIVVPARDPWGFNTLGKRKLYAVFGTLILIFAALVAAVGILAANRGGGDPPYPTIGPELPVSLVPSISPTEGGPALTSAEIEDLILQRSPADLSSISTEGAPQAEAFVWLVNSAANQDYFNMPNRLLQRFALATFYFSTNGRGWANSSGWLTNRNECEWFSTVMPPDEVCDRENFITSLDLQVNGLLGAIPPELAVLTRLSLLDLSGNHLYDFLPPLPLATSLRTLVVDDNEISNFLHTSLGTFTNLETISLNGNRLAGSIPVSLMNLKNLRILSLTNNFLGGTLPTEVGKFASLQFLDISGNDFVGQIPSELARATSLVELSLAHNNFEGTLPPELSRLVVLEMLDLSFNAINSDIISEIGFMTQLRTIWLHHNKFFGTIPSELGLLQYLKWLDISSNTLQGPIPTQLTFLTGLERLNAAENMITGQLPEVFPAKMVLSTMDLHANLLSGSLPSQLSNLIVEKLDLSRNPQLTGTIPMEVMKNVRFGALIDLGGTSLGGTIACLDEFTDKGGLLRVDCDQVVCEGGCCECDVVGGVPFS